MKENSRRKILRPIAVGKRRLLAGESAWDFLTAGTNKGLIFLNAALAVIYMVFIAFLMPKGNSLLFYLLIVGEIYHLWQTFTYLYTVWELDYTPARDESFLPQVDVYITVAGESLDVVEQTARAAIKMDYPAHKVFLLNDGFVAGKSNWREVEALAQSLGIECITRRIPGGAKAGNINHALRVTAAPFVAVFDADHAPHTDFLKKMLPVFADAKVAFAQSPQFYKNSPLNEVTGGSWEQQEIFFGPVLRGKNRQNSVFMCGTNMVIRKAALSEVGGLREDNIAEDFVTSLFIHQKGWKSVYVPEVLAEGLAPEDFLSYYKQQFRWARGSLEVMFKHNPLFAKGLSWAQKIQYLASASFYLSGIVVLIDALLPLAFFFTGKIPLVVSNMALAAVFLPYIFVTVGLLKLTSNFSLTFRAVAYSMAAFPIHLKAMWAMLTGQKNSFEVTSKKQLSGNFLYLAWPHMAYLALTLLGIVVAINREGLSAAFLSNLAWALFNCAVFSAFIAAAWPVRKPKLGEVRLAPSPVAIDITGFQGPGLGFGKTYGFGSPAKPGASLSSQVIQPSTLADDKKF